MLPNPESMYPPGSDAISWSGLRTAIAALPVRRERRVARARAGKHAVTNLLGPKRDSVAMHRIQGQEVRKATPAAVLVGEGSPVVPPGERRALGTESELRATGRGEVPMG